MITLNPAGTQAEVQRHLSKHTAQLRESIEELSTGKRINEAADDASGQAIASRIELRQRSRSAAQLNISKAISALQVGESGLDQIHDTLIRLRELAMQASDAVLTNGDRKLVQLEVDQLVDQINDLARTNRFGAKLFPLSAPVDIGFIVDSSASMGGEITALRNAADAFYDQFTAAGLDVAFGLADAKRTNNPIHTGGDDLDGVRRILNLGQGDFKGELQSLPLTNASPVDPWSALLNASGADDFPGENDPDRFGWRTKEVRHIVYISDTGRELDLLGGMTQQEVADKLAKENVVIHAIVPSSRFGFFSTIVQTTGGTLQSKGNNQGSGIPAALTAISQSLITGPQKFTAHVGVKSTDRFQTSVSVDATASGLKIENLLVTSQADARNTMDSVDSAQAQVSKFRTVYGAEINRLHQMHEGNATMNLNEKAAQSRIEDADFAVSTSNFARAQVLQRIAASILSQVSRITTEAALALLK